MGKKRKQSYELTPEERKQIVRSTIAHKRPVQGLNFIGVDRYQAIQLLTAFVAAHFQPVPASAFLDYVSVDRYGDRNWQETLLITGAVKEINHWMLQHLELVTDSDIGEVITEEGVANRCLRIKTDGMFGEDISVSWHGLARTYSVSLSRCGDTFNITTFPTLTLLMNFYARKDLPTPHMVW